MPTAIASDVQPVVQSFVADILKGVVGKSSDATSASSKSTDVKPDTPSVTDAADRSAALPAEAREESNGSPAETAASLKERGNEMMAKSASAKSVSERQPDVEEAEMLYSRALELLGKSPDSERAVLFANRAEARLRCGLGAGVWQGKAYLEGCIADASEALRLQKSYPKALFRRARAYLILACDPHAEAGSAEQSKRLASAIDDLKALLETPEGEASAMAKREWQDWLTAAPQLAASFRTRAPDGSRRRFPESAAHATRMVEVLQSDRTAAPSPSPPPPPPPPPTVSASSIWRGHRDTYALIMLAAGVLFLLFAGGDSSLFNTLSSALLPTPPPPPPPPASNGLHAAAGRWFKKHLACRLASVWHGLKGAN